jgi:RHS repeat-associated protein
MTECFYTMNGQMMAYDSGGVTKDFLTDHLGSITAEMDQNQNRTFETRYSAYGRNNWSTGTGCGFGWVGSYGYRETGLFHMSHYVRARHYSYVTGAWSTVDPLWPDESAYSYVKGRPSHYTDSTGLQCLYEGPSPLSCKREKSSRKDCFHCAYKRFQTHSCDSPNMSCQLANRLCGTNYPCKPCGICPDPPLPSSCADWSGIKELGFYLRGSNGGRTFDCSKSCGGYGVGDKLAHCMKGCIASLCGWSIGFIIERCSRDSDEDDNDAEDMGNDIGMRGDVWSFKDCLYKCTDATNGMGHF